MESLFVIMVALVAWYAGDKFTKAKDGLLKKAGVKKPFINKWYRKFTLWPFYPVRVLTRKSHAHTAAKAPAVGKFLLKGLFFLWLTLTILILAGVLKSTPL